MPKLVFKSEVSEHAELLTQIASLLGFDISIKEEKAKKKKKLKKEKPAKNDSKREKANVSIKNYDEIPKKAKSKLVAENTEDEDTTDSNDESEVLTVTEKSAKVKIKKGGKDKKSNSGFYDMDDDFMKDF